VNEVAEIPSEQEIKAEMETINLQIDTGIFIQICNSIKEHFMDMVTSGLKNSSYMIKEKLVMKLFTLAQNEQTNPLTKDQVNLMVFEIFE
jgi:hypothetical protein